MNLINHRPVSIASNPMRQSTRFSGIFEVKLTVRGKELFQKHASHLNQVTPPKDEWGVTGAQVSFETLVNALQEVVKELKLDEDKLKVGGGYYALCRRETGSAKIEDPELYARAWVDTTEDVLPAQGYDANLSLWFKDDPGKKELVEAACIDGLRDKLRDMGARLGHDMKTFATYFEMRFDDNQMDPTDF